MNREELKKAHEESLKQYEAYVNSKTVSKEHGDKITNAKKDWEHAWNELMETLLVLERLEI